MEERRVEGRERSRPPDVVELVRDTGGRDELKVEERDGGPQDS